MTAWRWVFLLGPLTIGLLVWAWKTTLQQDADTRSTLDHWKRLIPPRTDAEQDELAQRRLGTVRPFHAKSGKDPRADP